MFTDRVTHSSCCWKGGNGVVAWRREKFVPKGGPSGGNGGRGGSIILKADSQVYSLEWYRNRHILKADNGMPGGDRDRQGRSGADLILKSPLRNACQRFSTGEVLHDLTTRWSNDCYMQRRNRRQRQLCFKTPTNRAPNICTPGREGQIADVELELKLIADIGLVGFPNAGKSTLISALADVRVKIAPYPFTTLRPNLGFIQKEDYTRVFIADIPGIIEGAHRNRGLGFEFLRHIERTKLLLFVLDASGIDGRTPAEDYKVLQAELMAYNPEMLQRPYLVVLNKIDSDDAEIYIEDFLSQYTIDSDKLFKISAMNGEGIPALLRAINRFT